jgi:diphosphomevalonate decarboxylase
MFFEVTCSSPVNIAVIKYWGKRDTRLVLPVNSSLSLTLSQDNLCSTTTIRTNDTFDTLYLNGKLEKCSERILNVLNCARKYRKQLEESDSTLPKISNFGLTIVSVNNFPTAAGLASSASGLACLTFAIGQLYQLPISTEELSRLARLGSGSACRSLFGGFVKWEMGKLEDGSDSQAVQVAEESYWDINAFVLVVSESKKDTGSTEGMQETVKTSSLFKERLKIVPDRIAQMEAAIREKDFDKFAEITMIDSNQFHSVCLDTYPPIFYLNDISKAIIKLITAYNNLYLKKVSSNNCGYRCAYTFDAGPNAVLYMEKRFVSEVFAVIDYFFPCNLKDKFDFPTLSKPDEDSITKLLKLGFQPWPINSISNIIFTKVGDGPRVLSKSFDPEISLLTADGIPK